MINLRPLKHRLYIATSPLVPSSTLVPGLEKLPADYHPLEVPAYVRKRLVEFLERKYPIPPEFLQTTVPPSEVREVRAKYAKLREEGYEPGDILIMLGLVARKTWYSVPEYHFARIVSAGCICVEEENIIIQATSGEPVDDRHRVIWCYEALGSCHARTVADHAERARQLDRGRRGLLTLRFAS